MKRSLKPCAEAGCNSLTRDRYCDKHKQLKTEINKIYDKSRNESTKAFYHSAEWKRVRLTALIRDNYLCQMCLRVGKIADAKIVHHIVEVKDDWSKRLDLRNLESVCLACHNSIHKTK